MLRFILGLNCYADLLLQYNFYFFLPQDNDLHYYTICTSHTSLFTMKYPMTTFISSVACTPA